MSIPIVPEWLVKPTPEHTENDVEANIVNFLRRENWQVRRKHVGLFYTKSGTPIRIGEKGEPDWEAIRCTKHFDLEVKRPGKKPEKDQLEYIVRMNFIGNLAVWSDSGITFYCWYIEMLRRGLL